MHYKPYMFITEHVLYEAAQKKQRRPKAPLPHHENLRF